MIVKGGVSLQGGWKQDAKRGGLIYRAFEPAGIGPASGQGARYGASERFDPRTWELTINSQSIAPTFVYLASDIDSATGDWNPRIGGSDGNMTLQAGSPTYGVSSLLGVGGGADEGVTGDGTAYWQPGANVFGDVTTEDLVFEIAGNFASGANTRLLDKRGAGNGWTIYNPANAIHCYIDDGTGTATIAGASFTNAVNHVMFFLDRSGFGQCYVNRVASGAAVDISGAALTLTKDVALTLMAITTGATPYQGTVYGAAMWQGASWLDTHLQADVAAERYARWCGLYAQHSIPGAYVPTVTRATTKYYYRSSQSKLHLAGSGLVVIDEDGLHIEAAAENKCLQSQTLTVTWAKEDAGDVVTADALAAPDGTTTADSIAGDATDGVHGISQDITVTAASWVFSVYAKPGDKDWIQLVDSTVANADCYFDVANGTKGTAGAGATGGIISVGGGWYRCYITYTGTAAAHTHVLRPAHADTDNDFSGDGSTKNTYFWGAQVELGTYPSSYIPTTTAAVTRNADNVDLDSTIATHLSAAGQGTIEFEVMREVEPLANSYVFAIANAARTERIQSYFNSAGRLIAASASAGGDGGTAYEVTNICDGSFHRISISWRLNHLSIKVDGTEGSSSPDVSVTIPTGMDGFTLGSYAGHTNHLNGYIRNLRIYSYARH